MDTKNIKLEEANYRVITYVFEAICVGLTNEQREAISKRLLLHAERTNDSAQNATDKFVSTMLFSLSQVAVGKTADAARASRTVHLPPDKA